MMSQNTKYANILSKKSDRNYEFLGKYCVQYFKTLFTHYIFPLKYDIKILSENEKCCNFCENF